MSGGGMRVGVGSGDCGWGVGSRRLVLTIGSRLFTLKDILRMLKQLKLGI